MRYFKVLPEYDGTVRKDGGTLIDGELYTKSEMTRYAIPEKCTREVYIARSLIIWAFGARWQKGKVPKR